MRTASLFSLTLGAALLLPACGASSSAPPNSPVSDQPVPPSEQRALLLANVDLPQQPRCEESFDLQLYRNPGVELITWDDAQVCTGRAVQIRYLPRQLTRTALEKQVAALVDRVSFAQPTHR